MRKVVHLSDLHFGCADAAIVAALVQQVTRLQPDVVAVSGDLTQRARRPQFLEARAFLDALPTPQVVVPGNHDVPLYNVAARFLDPLGRFRRYVTADLQPYYGDGEIASVGINTTRSLTFKGGAIRQADVHGVCEKLRRPTGRVVKIVVGHHPFDALERVTRERFRPATEQAVEALMRCGADIFLTGHLHIGYTGHTAARYRIAGRSAIVVEAGTATSTRMRGEPNGFNLLHLDPDVVVVERYQWAETRAEFEVTDTQHFERIADGWSPAE
jgi:3',5'-cyclic AMP phosphodiesterase CpdA